MDTDTQYVALIKNPNTIQTIAASPTTLPHDDEENCELEYKNPLVRAKMNF